MPPTKGYQGRGSILAVSLDGVAAYISIAQLQKFAFGGMKATVEKITNNDSPNQFEEILPTIVDPGDIALTGVLDPANTSIANLGLYLQNQQLLFFKISLIDGTVMTFNGYVTDFNPVTVEYSKALMFDGKIGITGFVTITPGGVAVAAITTVKPAATHVGDPIEIIGTGFMPAQGSIGTVKVNGVLAVVIHWSDTIIIATVPSATSGGVIVHTKNGDSTPFAITIS